MEDKPMTITLEPLTQTTFSYLAGGNLFIVPGPHPDSIFRKMAFSRATHDSAAVPGCGSCKSGASYIWNAVNDGGILVHFCPDIPVIPLSIYVEPDNACLVRIVDDNNVAWEWDMENNWLDVVYEPGEDKPEDSGYPANDLEDVLEILVPDYVADRETVIYRMDPIYRTEED
jgi:hypothetical protein